MNINNPQEKIIQENSQQSQDQRQNFNKFSGERPRFNADHKTKDRPMKRPPLRETVMNMDKDLLKMLARRCNILEKMSAKTGKLEVREEKELRASWEKTATAMTKDNRIIQQLFALMQEITFSAKPEAGMPKRSNFNLAPPSLPVDINMLAPLVSRRSRLFLALAGASGSQCTIYPSLLDDATVEFIKLFNQCATSLAWDDAGTLIARQGGGLCLPDKVIHVGDDILNFFLLLGHYIGNNTRAKFTADSTLKACDLTAIRSFLPQLGARLSNVMPGSAGFPIRIECSGIFDEYIHVPANVPSDMILGLFLAAPFWPKAVSFDLRARADIESILEEALSVLTVSNATVRQEGNIIHFIPSPVQSPAIPELGIDLHFAAYILAFPFSLGGNVTLKGKIANCKVANDILELFSSIGLNIIKDEDNISSNYAPISTKIDSEESNNIDVDSTDKNEVNVTIQSTIVSEDISLPSYDLCQDERFLPLVAACIYLSALKQKYVLLPKDIPLSEMEFFFNHLGFDYTQVDDCTYRLIINKQYQDQEAAWTAPTPAWAMAYALCAIATPHIKLSNPGIMTGLYPQFWTLYNALPSFKPKENIKENKHDKPVRRRIITANPEGTGNGDSPDR